jgi:hypothetical protein
VLGPHHSRHQGTQAWVQKSRCREVFHMGALGDGPHVRSLACLQARTVDRLTLVRKSVVIRSRMTRCLPLYCTSTDPDVAKTAKSLLKHWECLFTFLEYEEVEPTNNSAERGLRPAVMWAKSASAINRRRVNSLPHSCSPLNAYAWIARKMRSRSSQVTQPVQPGLVTVSVFLGSTRGGPFRGGSPRVQAGSGKAGYQMLKNTFCRTLGV